MSRKKLGKGLSDLGLTELLSGLVHSDLMASQPLTGWQNLPIEQLTPGRLQPRRSFDEQALAELAASIRHQGILQPIIVRTLPTSTTASPFFEIVAGERRWRAAQLAELEQVPVFIRDLADQDAIAIALIENIQRRDLNVLEEAHALQCLIEEFKLTHHEIAQMIGKSRAAITNVLRLLYLAEEVKTLLASNQLEMGHARALLSLPEASQIQLAHEIVAKGLSVRATEEWVRRLLSLETKTKASTAATDAVNNDQLLSFQQRLADLLGTAVNIKQQANGKGRLIIHYRNWDTLEAILHRIE